MLRRHISGLPVVDDAGMLAGIIFKADFVRRVEIETQKRRGRGLQILLSQARPRRITCVSRGAKVSELMTSDTYSITSETPLGDIVDLMEKNNIKCLPAVNGGRLAGIVTRSNLLQAVSGLAGQIAGPSGNDDQLRDQIFKPIEKKEWTIFGLASSSDGVVHLSGVITDDRLRQAAA